jgi:putative PIN family toxin of toxin-antitoxin system
MIRAVLDANVVISGILSENGTPGKILKAWYEDRFHLVVAPAILYELRRVLQYPRVVRRHRWSLAQVREFLEDLASLAILTSGQLALTTVVAEDPSDDRYIECAIEGEATYIVSGDRHLLDLETYEGIEIVSPRAFIQLLS